MKAMVMRCAAFGLMILLIFAYFFLPWEQENTGMSGNKTAILTVPVTASRIGYMFKCVVSNDTESITSEAATILKKEETLANTP